jgi:dienelactone hydrolase
MIPQDDDGATNDDCEFLSPTLITLRAEMDGQPIVEATIERLPARPAIQRRIVRERGLVGPFFQSSDVVPAAGILLLGGSEGGLHELDAALLASHGYAVLALAYFGMEGVSPTLVNIPLEYFATAIAWLHEQPGLRTDCLGVLGGSRGGELALLLGTTFPAITAVVSYLGSGVITQGIGSGDILAMINTGQPSWTCHGQPLPYLRSHATPAFEAQVHAGAPIELRLVFLAALDNTKAVEAATIPVERINGAVLLVSTGDDRIWPNARLSEIAIDRLRRHGHPHPYHHLYYEPAGHGIIAPPYGPTTLLDGPGPGVSFSLGGTAKDNAFARADAWSHVLTFFGQQLQHSDAAVDL